VIQWASTKAAIGWVAARRRGPEYRGPKYEPRVQSSRADSSEAHMRLCELLGMVCTVPGQVERLYEWASHADDAVSLRRGDREAVRALTQVLRREGFVLGRAKPVATERREFVDLNTGRAMATKGAR